MKIRVKIINHEHRRSLARALFAMTNRLFLGRDYDKSSVIKLTDAKGKERIQISLAADRTPKINFLDEAGKIIYSLPEASKIDNK